MLDDDGIDGRGVISETITRRPFLSVVSGELDLAGRRAATPSAAVRGRQTTVYVEMVIADSSKKQGTVVQALEGIRRSVGSIP
jgi:hypothetical protein